MRKNSKVGGTVHGNLGLINLDFCKRLIFSNSFMLHKVVFKSISTIIEDFSRSKILRYFNFPKLWNDRTN